MQTSSEELQREDLKQKLAAKARVEAARKQIEADSKKHQETVAKENEEKKAELELLLEGLSEGQRRTVRMEAYLHVLRQGYDASQLQSNVDDTTRRLARYMLSGDV